jgi:hypothetical protein
MLTFGFGSIIILAYFGIPKYHIVNERRNKDGIC